jgi:hypothetical protein
MPVAKRENDASNSVLEMATYSTLQQDNWEQAVLRLLRELLMTARTQYVVWGRLLQGPPFVETLTRYDLACLIQTVERWMKSNSVSSPGPPRSSE